MSITSRALRALLRFQGDRSGQVVILFGLLLLPMLATVGAAVDYGRRNSAKTQLDAALDSAILALARRKTESYDETMVQDAKTAFEKEAAKIAGVTEALITIPLPTIVGPTVTVSGSYTAKVSTTLTKLMTINTMNIHGRAESSKRMFLFTDLYMALDVSQSMGLASTQEGAKTLFALIKKLEKDAGHKNPEGCVFGCHVPFATGTAKGQTKLKDSYQTIANKNGIKLRIDVLEDAVKKTIDTAETDSAGTNRYRMALYTMGLASANAKTYGLKELSPLTTSFSALRSAANGIDLGPNNSGGTGDTFLVEPLNDLRGKLVLPAGDGGTQATARTFLFLITDGLRDVPGGCTSGHCVGPLDPTVCKAYKDKNVTVGVIYTTFLPILKDPTTTSTELEDNYKALVQPVASQIAPNLQACATSSDWYAEATDGPAIDKALAKMFKQTGLLPSLTQ